MRSRTIAFCIGYGATMGLAMLIIHIRAKNKYIKNKQKSNQTTAMHRSLSYVKNKHLHLKGSSSYSALSRVGSQGSQMGTLAGKPPQMHSRRLGHWTVNRKLVLVMVGLPARGKSYIVKMLTRYLQWIGFPTKCFNIGDYRRKIGYAGVDKSFFEKENEKAMEIRAKMVEIAQDDMYAWLQSDDEAKVALFDATNTTKARRQILLERSSEEKNTLLVFIESICDDPEILAQNYKLKLQNDDYKNQNPDEALLDFKKRILEYESIYETIEDNEDSSNIQYIKLYNVGQKVVTRNCKGYLPSQVAFYLQNIHIGPRKIWLTRHAESVSQIIGGIECSELTESGRQYSMTLAKFIKMEQENIHITGPGKEILILAGTQGEDSETICHLQMQYPVATTPLLNELRKGTFSGMTVSEFKNEYPDIHAQREADKLDFRFPGEGGESYMDVIQRISPIIVELERQPRRLHLDQSFAMLTAIAAWTISLGGRVSFGRAAMSLRIFYGDPD